MDDGFPENMTPVWNIFYHFFLDKSSLDLLISQCRKLLELSQDMEAWYSGPYSRFLRISSSFTLSEMRKYWMSYVETSTTGSFKNRFVSEMKDAAKRSSEGGPILRSAGPLIRESLEPLRIAYRHYWKTGMVFTDQTIIDSATYVNPTFAHSTQGTGFMPHYATIPASTFHLAPAFTSTQLLSSTVPVVQKIVSTMLDQFSQWCMTFRGALARQPSKRCSVIIRLLVGDVFSSCYSLQSYATDGLTTANHRVSPWCAELLVLNEADYGPEARSSPPRTFNIIDTSNLSDHLGIVNILVAASPLLTRSPTSCLNTETLLGTGDDAITAFTKSLFGDIATISILLDLTPCSFVSTFTTYSNAHDILLHRVLATQVQYHERLFWKIPSAIERNTDLSETMPLSFDSSALGHLLFNIYLRMFHFEDISKRFGGMSLSAAREQDLIHYDRLSFVLFLQAVMRRTHADWKEVFRALLGLIRDDRSLIVGANQYHDLIAHLDALELYSATNFYPYGGLMDDAKKAHQTIPRLKNWDNVPPLLYMTLAVPREKLRVLDQTPPGNPNILVTIISRTISALNSFTIVQSAFGTIVEGDSPDTVFIKADPRGMKGDGFVLVSFRVPVSTLVLTTDARITLNVQSTPDTTSLIAKLGLYLELYQTAFEDAKHVWVTRYPPQCMSCTPAAPRYGAVYSTSTDCIISASVGSNADRITLLTFRQNFVQTEAKETLADRTLGIKATQTTPCGVSLSIGSSLQIPIAYCWPIEGSKAKLRVARQSSYIEVNISRPPDGHSI